MRSDGKDNGFFNSLTNFFGGTLFNVFSEKKGESKEAIERRHKHLIRELESMRAKLGSVGK